MFYDPVGFLFNVAWYNKNCNEFLLFDNTFYGDLLLLRHIFYNELLAIDNIGFYSESTDSAETE